ncbi:hypothetical protein TOPH_00591 [Tolypocladium ophioglossoides CBS 100239]|uniref:T6SS Phospholipase effector Tle1-like catalytic domain-containing protein n=1 Tax=Tolypocladium ophioglossoides (strain CBS 100239) TaxID=1163406 RepID=A0A0L0NKT1_TOLOC|nr:hypothetical protein TOPH_00591 [Tolypocladium ophioglossoides CBS 100239]
MGWERGEDMVRAKKRLIMCCDGTWMNSDYGFVKPGLLNGKGGLQVPSNVTRISRCFKRKCNDGTLQIINYESGVGSGNNVLDNVTGGAFGVGLAERVRVAYSYLCANYRDGDEIFLVGFSRGAFTARSVAGMIGNLGLLTREGVEHFYPIFKDMQNWRNDDYVDPFPNSPFPDKPKGPRAAEEYRARLAKMGYTRVDQHNGDLITIKAVCVWDTALALDETRAPFSPAVWERPRHARLTTDLRQVWFPGNHGNCGGGWDDQGVSNCTLAWMMDQMVSVGVEFDKTSLDRVIQQSVDFYETLHAQGSNGDRRKMWRWAVDRIFESNHPVRPWALGAIQKDISLLFRLSGESTRTPGVYRPIDPKTELDKERFLQDTNESVHSSVRVRLACEGLGLNDRSVWTCTALSSWRLKRVTVVRDPPQSRAPSRARGDGREYYEEELEERWVWKYVGDPRAAPEDPNQRIMWEAPLGPNERHLLHISGGTPNVYEYAERRANKSKRRKPSTRGSKRPV